MASDRLTVLPRRARTTSWPSYPIASNRLARNFTTTAPSQVWLADLTDLPTGEGWLYLAGALDMHTRKLVGWSMRETPAHPDRAIQCGFNRSLQP